MDILQILNKKITIFKERDKIYKTSKKEIWTTYVEWREYCVNQN